MPEPAATSFLGNGPSVARLNGMNIITEPTARKINGQKIVCTPVSGFSPMSSTPVACRQHRAGADHQARIEFVRGLCRRRTS